MVQPSRSVYEAVVYNLTGSRNFMMFGPKVNVPQGMSPMTLFLKCFGRHLAIASAKENNKENVMPPAGSFAL